MDIDITLEATGEGVSRPTLESLARFVARSENAALGRVDVALVDAERIEQLNREYLEHAGPTDVLSFDLGDDPAGGRTVQVIVCPDVARDAAPRHGKKPAEELLLYVIHGLLHVTGYDDADPDAAERMAGRQEELLRAFLHRCV